MTQACESRHWMPSADQSASSQDIIASHLSCLTNPQLTTPFASDSHRQCGLGDIRKMRLN